MCVCACVLRYLGSDSDRASAAVGHVLGLVHVRSFHDDSRAGHRRYVGRVDLAVEVTLVRQVLRHLVVTLLLSFHA